MAIRNIRSSRRSFLKRAAPTFGGSLLAFSLTEHTLAQETRSTKGIEGPKNETKKKNVWSREYWAQQGDTNLYLFRKRLGPPQPGEQKLPVLLLVHGSSVSSRSTFDLHVPGRG